MLPAYACFSPTFLCASASPHESFLTAHRAMRESMTFAPTLESLSARRVPDWYEDAKFGIFIHWGLFSIPAFAARSGSISDAFRDHYDIAVALTPYTEWYWNAIKVPESESAAHHREVWGSAPYESFREPFLKGLEQWRPAEWADLFAAA